MKKIKLLTVALIIVLILSYSSVAFAGSYYFNFSNGYTKNNAAIVVNTFEDVNKYCLEWFPGTSSTYHRSYAGSICQNGYPNGNLLGSDDINSGGRFICWNQTSFGQGWSATYRFDNDNYAGALLKMKGITG